MGDHQRQSDDAPSASSDKPADIGRREFLKEAGAIASVSASTQLYGATQNVESSQATLAAPQKLSINFKLNQQPVSVQVDSRTTLLDLLREQLHLTGTKKGCDQGACGACTVVIDDHRVLACLTLAATLSGKQVTTIEGLARGDQLHPMQDAFLRCDAFQCGYCTPGQIMSAIGCVREGHAKQSVEETREWMSGNLCRCSAYPNIVTAVRQVAGVAEPVDPAVNVQRFAIAAERGEQ